MQFFPFSGIQKTEDNTPAYHNGLWNNLKQWWNDHDSGARSWTKVVSQSFSGPTQGTSTNDSAAAGQVGESVRSNNSTGLVSSADSVWTNLVSISLTAGDWDVTGLLDVSEAAATTWVQGAISVNSGTTTTDHVHGDNYLSSNGIGAVGNGTVLTISAYRLSLSSTTTVYLKFFANGAGNKTIYGRLSARRVR
jgi:hypothetical protein